MRIRESAYTALVCLFFSVYNSFAQSRVNELYNGCGTATTNSAPAAAGNWDIQFLSQPRLQLQGLQVGGKAIFSSFTSCDIYDLNVNNWQTHQFSTPRRGIITTTAGQKAFFAGGARGTQYSPEFVSRVDIYNSDNDRWSHSELSQAREVGGAGSYGNTVIFAGGVTRNGHTGRADIFNTRHAKRNQHNLSDARTKLAVGAAGNKIVFAGGLSGNTKQPFSSSAVDIYEVHSNTWSTSRLSERRHDMAVASVGNRIIFAGGITTYPAGTYPSKTIDIYDAVRNTWTKATLSEAKHGMSVAVAGNKIYFAGGLLKGDVLSDKLEVYDVETGRWTITTISAPRHGMAVCVTGSRVIFAGGFINNLYTTTDRIEVLSIADGTWSIEHLSQPRTNITIVAYGDNVIFAGGTDHTGKVATAITDIWEIPTLVRNAVYTAGTNQIYPGRKQVHEWVYTDPGNRDFIITDLWKYETQTVKISVLNSRRQTVLTRSVIPFGDTREQINVSGLEQGRYWVLVECIGRKPVLTPLNIRNADPESHPTPRMLAMSAPPPTPDYFTSQY